MQGVSRLKLIINGDAMEIPDSVKTVSELLEHFQLDQKVVIVEKNKEILQKEHPVAAQSSCMAEYVILHKEI